MRNKRRAENVREFLAVNAAHPAWIVAMLRLVAKYVEIRVLRYFRVQVGRLHEWRHNQRIANCLRGACEDDGTVAELVIDKNWSVKTVY